MHRSSSANVGLASSCKTRCEGVLFPYGGFSCATPQSCAQPCAVAVPARQPSSCSKVTRAFRDLPAQRGSSSNSNGKSLLLLCVAPS